MPTVEKVAVQLSNPLDPDDAERMGLEKRAHNPGETVHVVRDWARGLIAAGYAQVDPEDGGAVAKALTATVLDDGEGGIVSTAPSEPSAEVLADGQPSSIPTVAPDSSGTAQVIDEPTTASEQAAAADEQQDPQPTPPAKTRK